MATRTFHARAAERRSASYTRGIVHNLTDTTDRPAIDWHDEQAVRDYATCLLRHSLQQDDAEFHPGQWEAIRALTSRAARLLVVQRTGWGKSSVYFVSTRLLRDLGAGPTLLVSPLLSLMRDQVRAAERLGVRAISIDSTNRDSWPDLTDAVLGGEIDALLVSPERLANEGFRRQLLEPLLENVGMFAVDEAHCISDWGHDFRPDYRRIGALLERLSPNVPVLATTATADDTVVADVMTQLGSDVEVVRGPLARASLRLQTIEIRSEAGRLAWLAEQLPKMVGSGIVYALTRAHAERIAGWLRARGIAAHAYTGGGRMTDSAKLELEQQLLDNEVKALVATPALGMGFDKPDLGFVVHFQMPQSLIHYYQQVGRAGRSIDDAYGILLHGDGDRAITDFFVERALPSVAQFEAVDAALRAAGSRGRTIPSLVRETKLGRTLVDQVLRHMSVLEPATVRCVSGHWRHTGAALAIDPRKMEALTARRRAEQQLIEDYVRTDECLMRFIARALDDPLAQDCGRCGNCCAAPPLATGWDPLLATSADESQQEAATTRRRQRRKRPVKARTTARRSPKKKSTSRTVARSTAIRYVDQAINDGRSAGRASHIVDELIVLRCELADGKGGRFNKGDVLRQIEDIIK